MESDNSLIPHVGISFEVTSHSLGQGSYGSVYTAVDEKGAEYAVKCCKLDETGIPNILEASIMASLRHPHINHALRIHATDGLLYIIQEKAETDLSHHTRIDKSNYQPTLHELQRWCFSIAQGVAALHFDNIIHADIKASNVLLFSTGVRLTDFTLATKQWYENQTFTHHVCTCTHRPIECLLKKPWDKSLDIWSLGCTFYEIAYGELLFPYQGEMEERGVRDNEAKKRIQDRSINAIIQWGKKGPNAEKYPLDSQYHVSKQIDYTSYAFNKDYYKPEMAQFNELLHAMLRVNPQDRISISQVLQHPFFTGLQTVDCLVHRRPLKDLSIGEHARIYRYVQQDSSNPLIQELAVTIYRMCDNISELITSATSRESRERILAAGCVWIAGKVIDGYPPDIRLPQHSILAAEREICHNVNFRIHHLAS